MNQKVKNMLGSDRIIPTGDAINPALKSRTAAELGQVHYFEFRKEAVYQEEAGVSTLKSFMAELVEAGHGESIARGRKALSSNFVDAEGAPTLRSLRMSAGLSQAQLAEKAKLKQYQVSRYENGIDNPQIETAKRIRKALGVDAATFYRIFDNEEE